MQYYKHIPIFQAKGGGLAFIQGNLSSFQQNGLDGEPSQGLLVYIDGNHEYVVFDPHGNKACELSLARREANALEETGTRFFLNSSVLACCLYCIDRTRNSNARTVLRCSDVGCIRKV